MAVSTALANAMLGGLPGSSYVQIHSGDPGPSGTSNVIAGPGRALVTLPAASGGQRALLTNVDVPSVPQGASVTHVTYWDAASGGTFSHSEALGVTVTFAYAGTLRFTSQTFTVTTAASGSQTATSVVADSASASDASVIVLRVAVSDAATSADLAATGIPHIDSATSADANAIRLGVVVSDASSTADTAIGNSGGVSTNLDTASIADSVGITQATLSANTDTASAGDSNTASQSAPSSGITYVGAGALASNPASYGSETVAVPAGLQAGDIMVLATSNAVATPAGWTQKATGGVVSKVFWKRATASESAVALSTDDGGGEGASFGARIYAWRGCVGSGDPFDAADAGITMSGSSSTGWTGTSLTTSANAMVGMAVLSPNPNATAAGGSADTLVAGGSATQTVHLVYDSTPPNTSGAQAAPTVTLSASTIPGRWTFALKAA